MTNIKPHKLLIVPVIILVLNSGLMAADKKKEWFFLGFAPSFSIDDNAYGGSFKIGIPMQRNFYFVAQANAIPDFFDHPYEEYRYEFAVELTPLRIKKFSIYGAAGLNFGYWKRKNNGIYLNPTDDFFNDNSLMFGGGLNYDLGRTAIYSEFKTYPEIWANHFNIGIKVKFYQSEKTIARYYRFIQDNSNNSSGN